MIDIARDADVSTATLYKHFASKEALFFAVLSELRHMRDHKQWLTTAEGSVEEILMGWARDAVAAINETHLCPLLRLVIAETPSTPELARAVFARILEKRQHLVDFLDGQIEKKNLKPHDTEFGARVLHSVLKDYFIWPALFEPDFSMPPDTDQIINKVIGNYLTVHAV